MAERSEATQIALITTRNQLLVTILAGLFGLAATWLAGRSTGERRQQAQTANADERVAALELKADEREKVVTELRRQLAQARAACSTSPPPPTGGDIVSAEGFTNARRSCELKRDELVCEFLATADREDASLALYSWSRLIESNGNEMLASRIRFGREEQVGQSQSVRVNLVRGVPVGMTVTFAGLTTAGTSATVPVIELIFNDLRAQFRDVPLRPS